MLRVLLGTLFLPLAGLAAPIVPCAPGSLVDYINLGSEGCSIGDKVLFDFTELTIPTGSTPINSESILLTPVDRLFLPELQFTVNASAAAGQFLDTRFAYSVASNRYPMVGLTLDTTGASAFGDAAATVITDSCVGDVFYFDLCFASTGTPLITFATATDLQTSDQTTFEPTFTIGVANDIGIDGGLTGGAALSTVTNRIAEIPEPATRLLSAAGLLAAVSLVRRSGRST